MVKPSGVIEVTSTDDFISRISFCRSTHVNVFIFSSRVRACAAKISGGLSEEVSKVISSSFAESVSNLSTGAEISSSISGAVFASGTINRSRDDVGVDACATEISGEEAESGAFMAGAETSLGTDTEVDACAAEISGVVIRTSGRIGTESMSEDESEMFGTGAESESESGLTVTC